ncbi:MAG: M20/M25/M40 family metallo-hydrolase, partial [Gemmatimonadetes bacterium]|nr:M20/M25/M40 family metallo-hydrolase [Gemmatimonadota bacterium]NIQ55421.1 M20/M25/M40 family metallo-hydrolase [Gemmatimonadota bacterium]NIU75631.1 M20/M25/M40 family metallo-hydrolase [Gammaproteobacteria bacterium]NIX21619.1 M20/M25/M40 family metallo-hydrolase [Actinomycetota bacterium]NIX45312.1 M20/M25/M40 family metallo-hydrolase [Gemmatimonadota bacterium]
DGLDRVYDAVRARADAIAGDTGTSFGFRNFYISHAAPTDPAFRDVIEAAAESLGLSRLRMPSGAGHDAQSVARFAPIGMVFVPSRDGISHSPQEWTPPEDVTN